ncbi:MAG: MOFRL family protein, partial [Anaerolineae bacterium]
LPANHCLILGGETTVTLRGNGIGGRNLETILSAAVALDGAPRRVVAGFATDGDDGPTQAAGAIVTGETGGNGRLHHHNPLPYLDNNDSYTFFQQIDAHLPPEKATLIQTGLTGTNVNDLIFILSYQESTKEIGRLGD